MLCAILTLFPEVFKPYLAESILGIAQKQGQLQVELVDFRNFTKDRHGKVDDRPFGGGPGMVLTPQPIFDAIEATEQQHGPFHRVMLCPRGTRHTQKKARELSQHERLLLLCGRYEGFDERIRLGMDFEEISIGDYILAGGELAALVVLESAARLLPGVLGCAESAELESFELGEDLVDYPQYTRPREFRGMTVPEILMSGNHQAVDEWRRQQAEQLSQLRRESHDQQNNNPD